MLQVWYAVPPHGTKALEEAMADALPHLFEATPNLLHQLVTTMSPTELKVGGRVRGGWGVAALAVEKRGRGLL